MQVLKYQWNKKWRNKNFGVGTLRPLVQVLKGQWNKNAEQKVWNKNLVGTLNDPKCNC